MNPGTMLLHSLCKILLLSPAYVLIPLEHMNLSQINAKSVHLVCIATALHTLEVVLRGFILEEHLIQPMRFPFLFITGMAMPKEKIFTSLMLKQMSFLIPLQHQQELAEYIQ